MSSTQKNAYYSQPQTQSVPGKGTGVIVRSCWYLTQSIQLISLYNYTLKNLIDSTSGCLERRLL